MGDVSIKAVVYSRFSPRPNADECRSNEQQLGRCRAYCDKQGYEVMGNYSDEAITGKFIDRPGLSEALETIEPGMVLVVDTSCRLARDMLVNLTIRGQVASAGGTIEFADGSPSATTPEGELVQNVLAAFAAYERARYARRTKQGLAKKAARGEHCGRVPYGYKINPDTKCLVEDDAEQVVIEDIVSLYTECKRPSAWIAADLNKSLDPNESYTTFRGKPWSARTIRRIITRELRNP